MKKCIATSNAPQALGPYSQAIEYDGTVYLSGQIAIDENGNLKKGIEAQTKQVFANLKAVLAEASLTFDNVVKTTVFMSDLADFAIMNEIYATYFNTPFPARGTVQVARLPKDALVEIECIAIK